MALATIYLNIFALFKSIRLLYFLFISKCSQLDNPSKTLFFFQ